MWESLRRDWGIDYVLCGRVWGGFGGVSLCCVCESFVWVWGCELCCVLYSFCLFVGLSLCCVWYRLERVWKKRVCAVCVIVFNGFGGLIFCCVWESLGRNWGSDLVLCVRDFGVGLGNECVLCVGEFKAGLGD